MIRLIIRHDDATMAANAGGAVLTTYRTFDIVAPKVEVALKTGGYTANGTLSHVQVIGVELIDDDDDL